MEQTNPMPNPPPPSRRFACKIASLFRHNGFHLDGPGVARHLDPILTLPHLVAVPWAQGGNANALSMQWVPLIQKIQHSGKSVIEDLQVEELDNFIKAVDPAGIMLWVNVEPSRLSRRRPRRGHLSWAR